jgi:hypothetical protein
MLEARLNSESWHGKLRGLHRLLGTVVLLPLLVHAALAIDPDPLQPLKTQVHTALATAPDPAPTGYVTDDYLTTVDGIVQYFRNYQQTDGRIFDPYANREVQYSTPYYALCGSVLYTTGYRTDPAFLESVALALDRATWELANSAAADGHSNFFVVPCMLAYWHLENHVDSARVATWESRLTSMSTGQYNTCCLNWMLTASTGDYLRYLEFEAGGAYNIDTGFMEARIAQNMSQWTLEGLYRDGGYPYSPMAYDGFGRLNFQLLDLHGYDATGFPGAADISEYNRRGAWTSMLMQSPWGEMPLGGRSAQHQWNETEMCFIYEVWAARAAAEGDLVSARAFKRAARLSYSALRRWVTPQGYVLIVKNHVDPAERFGYEIYSYLSQYNLWTAGFLSLAAVYADDTLTEGPAPADIGGFAFQVPDLHKGFANCGGLYLQIDMDPEDDYDIAGLVRIHKAGVEPLVGPSASTTNLEVLDGTPALGTGIAWNTGSSWQSLADVDNSQISSFNFNVNAMSSAQVDFSVTYNLSGVAGASSVTEHYVVTPVEATVTASVSGSATQTRLRYAAFLFDGQDAFTVGYDNGLAQTKLNDSLMTMELTSHPATPFVRVEDWVNSRNGYLEPIEGTVNDTTMTYVLRPELDPNGTKFVAANQYTRTDFSPYTGIPAYPIVASTASSEEAGNPTENSHDNSAATRWANTNEPDAWIEYDLGQDRVIDQVYLHLFHGDYRTYYLMLEIDGTEIWNGATTPGDDGWTKPIVPTTGRIVRIATTAPNSDGSDWFSIYEAKIGNTGTPDPTPPAAPTGLVATPADSTVELDWDDNTEVDLASYNVYRDTAAGGPYTQIASGVPVSAFADATVVNGVTYYYVVTAVDTLDIESEDSNEAPGTPQPPAPLLVAHYAFEGDANDSSGNGHHAATIGSPGYAPHACGQAIDLDGADDTVTLPAGVADSGDITVAAWVNWDGGDGWQRIFDFGNNTTQYMFLTPSSADASTLRFAITIDGNRREQRVETSQLTIGAWVHVAVTLAGDVATLYVDGIPAASNTAVTLNPTMFTPVINYIGTSQWSDDPLFDGRIDDFRIYNHALSEAEIADLAAGATEPGDLDGDCDVDAADAQLLVSCMNGPDVTTPPAGCDPDDFARADLDADGDVDLADVEAFHSPFGG